MTETEIEAFLTVVQCGSMSAAAEQLYVTQPALSRRIRNLETELGYELFARGEGLRGTSLTEHGKAFLSVARKWDAVYREARAIKDMGQRPVLSVASIGSVGACILPPVLKELASHETPFNLDFHSCHSWEGRSLVSDGFADLALIDHVGGADAGAQGGIMSLPVLSTPFVLIGGEGWNQGGSVNPLDLDPRKEIRLPWNAAFDEWHKHWFDASARPRARVDHASSIKDVLRDDLFAIVPLFVATHLQASDPAIKLRQLEDGPADETIHCLVSASSWHEPPVRHFLELLERRLRSYPEIHCLLDSKAS